MYKICIVKDYAICSDVLNRSEENPVVVRLCGCKMKYDILA